MHKLNLLSIVIMLAFAQTVQSQEVQIIPQYRQYGTQEYMRLLLESNPEVAAIRAQQEQQTYDYRTFGQVDTLSIPVVFHVLYLGDDPYQLSEKDIMAQMNRLNIDFFEVSHPYLSEEYKFQDLKLEGSDTKVYLKAADRIEGYAQKAAQTKLQFCLATTDPLGNATTGVNYVKVESAYEGISDKMKSVEGGGADAWPMYQYCNVWIVPMKEDLAGYAQMPGGPDKTDGIVLNSRFFARHEYVYDYGQEQVDKVFAMGRTLTHLMGSYLNLHELWNESEPCGDDMVDDTPIHNAPNWTLDEYQHVSTCGDYPVEMTMNLMDNTPDSAQYMFTHGQVMRMQATLAIGGSREKLAVKGFLCRDGNRLAEGSGDRNSKLEDATRLQVEKMQIRAYPNPTSGDFTTEIKAVNAAEAIEVRVYNTTGNLQWSSSVMTNETQSKTFSIKIPSQSWPAGLYRVQVQAGLEYQTVQVMLER
jgi:hypothetical protein